MSTSPILVTGGAGFIGSNLVKRLTAGDRCRVRVLDDCSTGTLDNLAGVNCDVEEASILDADALNRAVRGCRAIVHLAAQGSVPRSLEQPVSAFRTNAQGTLDVLEAARSHNVRHVVFAGSSSVYGANPTLPKHEALQTMPMSPYAASKLAAEATVLAYQHSYGLATLAFRFFNVFGPGQRADHAYAAAIPRFVTAALLGNPVTLYGDGQQTRDFTFVDTVTATIDDALHRRVTHHGPVNLALGGRISLLEVIDTLQAQLGLPVAVEHLPPRTGDVAHSSAAATTLRQLFPAVQETAFDAGLRATIAWLRSQTSCQAGGNGSARTHPRVA